MGTVEIFITEQHWQLPGDNDSVKASSIIFLGGIYDASKLVLSDRVPFNVS